MNSSSLGFPVSMDPSLSDVTRGVFRVDGELEFDGDRLRVEFELKGWKSRVLGERVVEIPAEGLREVELKRRSRGSKLILRPRKLGTLYDIPGERQDALVLKVQPEDIREAERLHARLQLIVSESSELSIPFQLPDIGLEEVTGLLSVEDELLVFDVSTGLSGVYRDEQEIIKIEAGALEEISLRHGAAWDHIVVRPKTGELLDAMPGTYKAELKLKVSKRYRDAAEQLVRQINQVKRG